MLMDLANQRSGLVLGTGDLSESALGLSPMPATICQCTISMEESKTLIRHLIE